MKKFKIEFSYQDTSKRGLNFKTAKRTVKAKTEEDAIRKVEQALMTDLINPICTEIIENE